MDGADFGEVRRQVIVEGFFTEFYKRRIDADRRLNVSNSPFELKSSTRIISLSKCAGDRLTTL
jgi:hypothetical protein